MKPPYRLIPDTLSKDTIQALRALLADAEAGRLIGMAFAGMYRRQEYVVNAAGEADRSPTFALGMVEMLSDELRLRARKEK